MYHFFETHDYDRGLCFERRVCAAWFWGWKKGPVQRFPHGSKMRASYHREKRVRFVTLAINFICIFCIYHRRNFSMKKLIKNWKLSFSFQFSDINECDENKDDCDSNALCTNNIGSFTCKCNKGYTGDGKLCQGNK